MLLYSSTGYQTFKHGLQISKHVRACRHVKIGPESHQTNVFFTNQIATTSCNCTTLPISMYSLDISHFNQSPQEVTIQKNQCLLVFTAVSLVGDGGIATYTRTCSDSNPDNNTKTNANSTLDEITCPYSTEMITNSNSICMHVLAYARVQTSAGNQRWSTSSCNMGLRYNFTHTAKTYNTITTNYPRSLYCSY